jgi:hypothetical protein
MGLLVRREVVGGWWLWREELGEVRGFGGVGVERSMIGFLNNGGNM